MLAKLHWDRLTVMVVDDNRFMCRLIVSTIRAFGIEDVIAIESAADAIQRLKQSKADPLGAGVGTVDLIFSDFVMPLVDGNLFLRWIRADKGAPDRFVPFIMLSGAAGRGVVEQARDAGCTEFMAKPFSAQVMAERILYVINHPRPYILARGYFGPDRRRAVHPVEVERRTTQPSQIQVLHRASNERTLRDDVRAIHFHITNRLKDKLGPNALKGQVDLDPALIRAAEMRIQEMVADYSDWVERYIASMRESHETLKTCAEETSRAHIAKINGVAYQLLGQGNVFDYPLITDFGKSLYDITGKKNLAATANLTKLIGAHIDTIRTVFSKRIKGDGGEVGRALVKEIEAAVGKYHARESAAARGKGGRRESA